MRLRGGEVLIDLTSLGNITLGTSVTLPDDVVKVIKQIAHYDGLTTKFMKLDKPILAKCSIDYFVTFIYIDEISDDNLTLNGYKIHSGPSTWEILIDSSDFTMSISQSILSVEP